MKKNVKIIFYLIYVSIITIGLLLSITTVIDKNILSIIYIIAIAVIFLVCCNSFYVPRVMDNQQMLENKNQMKSDPILWKELIILEIPLIFCFIVLMFIC